MTNEPNMSALMVKRLTSADVGDYHAGIVDAFAEVFADPPWNETQRDFDAFANSLCEYAAAPGFRGAVLLDDAGGVQGFALGMDWEHDHWWCSRVEEDLGPQSPAWTDDCFHLVELAVRHAYRGEGHGAALYDALVGGIPDKTAILSTNRLGPVAAASLYARRGWRLLLEEWRHCVQCEPVQVLGLCDPGLIERRNRS